APTLCRVGILDAYLRTRTGNRAKNESPPFWSFQIVAFCVPLTCTSVLEGPYDCTATGADRFSTWPMVLVAELPLSPPRTAAMLRVSRVLLRSLINIAALRKM